MSKSPTVSVIIVNWNGLKFLKPCIKSLESCGYRNLEIIVVDNGSTDGSIKYIEGLCKHHKSIKLIINPKNLGYAEANNIGVGVATGAYILFLNNDTVVTKGFLSPLIAKLEVDTVIAAVQPKILQTPNTKLIDSVGSYLIGTGFLYHYGHNKSDLPRYNIPSRIFSMKGACMLYRHDVLKRIGVFDPDYFAYFEETDLCHRTWLAGYEIWYEPLSVIYHRGGETSRLMDNGYITYHSYKNRIYTYSKNLEASSRRSIIPLHIVMCWIVALAYLLTGRLALAFALHRAILWNFAKRTTIGKKRREIAQIRAVPDRAYLPIVTKHVRVSYYYHLFSTSLRGYID